MSKDHDSSVALYRDLYLARRMEPVYRALGIPLPKLYEDLLKKSGK